VQVGRYGENRGLIAALAGVMLGLALALTGCGQGGGTSGQDDDTSPRPSSPSASGPSSASPGSSASPSAGSNAGSAGSSVLPAAADGTDLAACADGRCEVQVGASAKIPVPRRLDVTGVRVRSIDSDTVTIVGRLLGNRQSGFCTGVSCSSSGSGDGFQLELGADSTGSENGLSITAVAIDGGRAVLRLAPA
jgi:hypothetical protein